MTAPQATTSPAKLARMLYAALTSGVIMFALVAHFLLKPQWATSSSFPPIVPQLFLALALGASAIALLLLRRRIPRRAIDDSADLFWSTASQPALIMWAVLEAASLLAILTYALTASPLALPTAVVAVLFLVVLNPAYLERP